MIERCPYRHFADLTENQQDQMLALLNRGDGEIQRRPWNESHLIGHRPVALLMDEKVIAAMVTDKDHHVVHWAGKTNRKFLDEFKRTPAMELMRSHIEQLKGRPLTFHGVFEEDGTRWPFGFAEGNLFKNRYSKHGIQPEIRDGVWNYDVSKLPESVREKLKPKIPCNDSVWRLYRPH